jgi:YggT family protein
MLLPQLAPRPPIATCAIMNMLVAIAIYLLTILLWMIIVQAVLSWLIAFNVINTHNDFVRTVWTTLDRITEPLYRPIRKIMPDFGALDLSPLVVIVALNILIGIVLPSLIQPVYIQ